MLAAAAPEVVLVELPEEFGPWLPYLADPETVPPVALAGARGGGADGEPGGGLVFLPFAEFSPELAAIRWARAAGVEVVACDLPLSAREAERTGSPQETPGPEGASGPAPGALAAALRARAGGRPGDDLWDRLVEAVAPGSGAEALRRAALLAGWALRADAGAVDPYDLRREAHMRRRLAEHRGRRTAAVIGAFHAPALLPGGVLGTEVPSGRASGGFSGDGSEGGSDVGSGGGSGDGSGGPVISLVPYAYALLDERSGYPAGIRDPEWQRGVFLAGGDRAVLDELLTESAVRICAAVREAGHPSGPVDAREIVRVARDLAALRGLPAAGRGELVEAVETVLTQGQLLGRGRVVAAAMEEVLVGSRQGRPAPGTPRSGLGPAVEALLAALSLPSPADPARRELRLDAHRSERDRRREVALRRLAACRIPYGEEGAVAGVGEAGPLTTRWTVEWTPSTAAMLDLTGAHGVTLGQAAAGLLRRRRAAERRAGGPTAAEVLTGLEEAAQCGLPEVAAERLAEAAEVLPASGTLPEVLAGLALVDRLRAGHLAGLPAGWERVALDAAYKELATAGVRALDGLAGSTAPADARALVALADRATGGAPGGGAGVGLRLDAALRRLDEEGTPLIRGAAGASRVLLGLREAAEFGVRLASRVDGATTPALRADLAAFLHGTLLAAGPLLETGRTLDPLLDRVESLPDRGFLDRLPALRAGFDILSPAARSRLLAAVRERTGQDAATLSPALADPAMAALLATADLAGREALTARGLGEGDGDREGTGRGSGGDGVDGGKAEADAASRPPGAGAPGAGAPGAGVGRAGEPAAGAGKAGAPLAEGHEARTHQAEAHRGGGHQAEDHETGTHQAGAHQVRGHGVAVSPAGAPVTATAGRPGVETEVPGTGTGGTEGVGGGASALEAGVRWRLLLGKGRGLSGRAGRIAGALDELYGYGRGEGARGEDRQVSQGGDGAPYPDVRAWSEELAALFGPGVREEVLAAAADAGRFDAALELDPASARPSVELLRTVLSYAGGLPEQRLARLRPLVARLVAELTRALAHRMRPALTGLAHPRPTRRPGGPLDLPRTLRANLATARRDAATGAVTVLPERPVFRTRARRSTEWRLILVVDVSASMEASTIWAALTASVLTGVPALSTHFIAFSTEVVDLTDQVDDPLSLLLEVQVGGGTNIARGLRHARSLVTVPSRTLTVVISDFEEGGPVSPLLAEVRALVDSGCHVLGCASLDDKGRPRYSTGVAGQLVGAGMPVAALSPLELARWVGERVGGVRR
ncbi:DUF5682 family protein [Streptomyces sp. NPDC093085]|uniref:DUF5682 family protein n=1 Tax=Streptomyces sp. NPDC093085 TaxID=3155068 RepID=UPI0034212604